MAMRILLLDDEPSVGRVLMVLMKKLKHEGVYVPDCLQAWEVLQNSRVDLLIADLVLPGMSGIELVEKLRQDERFKELPVLMISGKARQEDIVKAARLGINGFIAKPFKPKDLQEKIEVIRGRSRPRAVDRGIKQIWDARTTLYSDVDGPLIVFGEPVDSLDALRRSSNRDIAVYLGRAYRAIAAANEAHPGLGLGYIVENDTTDLLLQLKKRFIKSHAKLILISARCPGKPILLVRMFTINRRDKLPVFLVYDHLDDIPKNQRQGLEELDVKLIERSALNREKFQELIDQYVQPQAKQKKLPDVPQEEALPPQEIHDRIVRDIEVMTHLPPLPQVYRKILALSKKPESDLKNWIKVIRLDPMTCATILRHANSLSYGFRGEIEDIDRAVILLGKNTVASLVACEAMKQAFGAVQERGFVVEDFWRHSLAVGRAAHILSCPVDDGAVDPTQNETLSALGLSRQVVELLRGINLPKRLRLNLFKENPFLGGIMHDIGKMAMVHSYPGLFPLLLSELERNRWNLPMLAVEQAVCGDVTHTTVGEVLLRNWGMGKALANVALCHHQPEMRDTFSFLISLADIVGQVLYPFPRQAEYPLARALETGALDSVGPFLPEEFFDQPLCSGGELISMVEAISPHVRDYVGEMDKAVQA